MTTESEGAYCRGNNQIVIPKFEALFLRILFYVQCEEAHSVLLFLQLVFRTYEVIFGNIGVIPMGVFKAGVPTASPGCGSRNG